jgi:hypothetical protein
MCTGPSSGFSDFIRRARRTAEEWARDFGRLLHGTDVAPARNANMTIRPADLQRALARARTIGDLALREAVDRVLAAAVKGDAMAMVEILAGLDSEPKPEPWLEMSRELFGDVPAEGFGEDLPRDEELGSPEVLESPEEVLRPLDREPSFDDLARELFEEP